MSKIAIKLSDQQEDAFAEFLKRVLPEDFESLSDMWDVGVEILRALAEKWLTPRYQIVNDIKYLVA